MRGLPAETLSRPGARRRLVACEDWAKGTEALGGNLSGRYAELASNRLAITQLG